MSATPHIPDNALRIEPQPGPQEQFLRSSVDIVFYGGSAGGGKTYALLLEPLYHIDNTKFGAVIFRRTTPQITQEGALWDEASDLYRPLGARLNQQYLSCTFPSGAKVTFAHMEREADRYSWQGAQIPLIGFDELTHFTWRQFSYLMSRNRSTSGVSARIRGTCNPDPDHWLRGFIDWYIGDDGLVIDERSGVVRWFVTDGDDIVWADTREELSRRYPGKPPKSFTFIRSRLEDNRILCEMDPDYAANLEALPRVDRAALRDGNWNVRPSAGMFFQRSDFEIVDAAPGDAQRVRAWDQAGTKPNEKKKDDPDWTAGVKMSEAGGVYYIEHVERFRDEARTVDRRIKNTAANDGKPCMVRLAQDPGQAGKSQARSQASMLAGYVVKTKPVTGDKQTRAKPLSSQVESGNVKLVRGSWNEVFLAELEAFPDGAHDDQVDAAADAFDELNRASGPLLGRA